MQTAQTIEVALRELANKRADVVIVLATNLFVTYTPEIAAAALAMKLPTVCEYREHVIEGALISYGVDLSWCFQRSGYFIDKILHGAAPGDLPIEFPTKFPLSINLKTAKELNRSPLSTFVARPRPRGDHSRPADFRLWHLTDLADLADDVRF